MEVKKKYGFYIYGSDRNGLLWLYKNQPVNSWYTTNKTVKQDFVSL